MSATLTRICPARHVEIEGVGAGDAREDILGLLARPPAPRPLRALVRCYAAPSLSADEADTRWQDCAGRYERLQRFLDQDSRYARCDEDMLRADLAAAIDGFLGALGAGEPCRRIRAVGRNRMTGEQRQAAREFAIEDMGADW